jgi:hypothetical protein
MPSEVVAAVKVEYGIVLVRQAIERYDPGKASSRGLGKRWVDFFHAKRAEYIRRRLVALSGTRRAFSGSSGACRYRTDPHSADHPLLGSRTLRPK